MVLKGNGGIPISSGITDFQLFVILDWLVSMFFQKGSIISGCGFAPVCNTQREVLQKVFEDLGIHTKPHFVLLYRKIWTTNCEGREWVITFCRCKNEFSGRKPLLKPTVSNTTRLQCVAAALVLAWCLFWKDLSAWKIWKIYLSGWKIFQIFQRCLISRTPDEATPGSLGLLEKPE